MMHQPSELSHAGVLNVLARELAIAPATIRPNVPSDQVLAEYLRETLALLATDGGRMRPEPVHIASLTNQVERQLRAVWPVLGRLPDRSPVREQENEADTDPNPTRRVLDALHALRDVANVGGGYWLPTPTRLVSLSPESATRDEVLVVGGRSTAALRRTNFPQVALRWIARVVPAPSLGPDVQDDPSRWQSLPDWLGTPPVSLEDWTAATLESAERSLAPSSADLTEFQVYIPEAASRRPQALRWMDVQRLAQRPTGLVLCRTTIGSWSIGHRYWLGTVLSSDGRSRAGREAEVNRADVRRLQYGLDLRADAPTRIAVTREGAATTLSFPNFLPAEEHRLLIAFGLDASPVPGRLPLRYRFNGGVPPVVLSVLRGLGVVVEDHARESDNT